MIKPCAKARLLGQTRKPNTDWKPNYGLLTRSAWMFRGNPWESVGHGKWLPCEFHCPSCPYRCDMMWWLPRSQLSKCGYSWIFNCPQNAVMAKIIDAQVACSRCVFLFAPTGFRVWSSRKKRPDSTGCYWSGESTTLWFCDSLGCRTWG